MTWPEKTYSNIDFWKLDVWDDWVVDWVSEKGLKDKAQEYYNKAKQDGISWKALGELWTNLWLLLQSQNINETILKTWYEESRAKIKAEQKQALQEEKLPELAGYFWDSSIINELQAKLKESWLSLISILENYKKFIENSLALPLWSTITQEQHNQMIANIKILILSRLQETWVELEKLKVENWWNLKWYQLDANNKLAVNLKDIREPLLAGALYLLKTSIEDAPESFKTKEEYEKAKERKNYSMSLNSRLIKNTYKLWDQMNSWGMLYEKISLEELEETNLLTEQDKLIEEKMNMWIMWCCLLSVCPWVWEIMDWINISSSEWEFVSILRKAWIIPEWYKISKSMTDTIITTIWLIASIWTLWLAGRAVKIEKLWRVLAGIWWSMDKAKRWLLLLIQWLWDKWRELAKVVWNFFPDLWFSHSTSFYQEKYVEDALDWKKVYDASNARNINRVKVLGFTGTSWRKVKVRLSTSDILRRQWWDPESFFKVSKDFPILMNWDQYFIVKKIKRNPYTLTVEPVEVDRSWKVTKWEGWTVDIRAPKSYKLEAEEYGLKILDSLWKERVITIHDFTWNKGNNETYEFYTWLVWSLPWNYFNSIDEIRIQKEVPKIAWYFTNEKRMGWLAWSRNIVNLFVSSRTEMLTTFYHEFWHSLSQALTWDVNPWKKWHEAMLSDWNNISEYSKTKRYNWKEDNWEIEDFADAIKVYLQTDWASWEDFSKLRDSCTARFKILDTIFQNPEMQKVANRMFGKYSSSLLKTSAWTLLLLWTSMILVPNNNDTSTQI